MTLWLMNIIATIRMNDIRHNDARIVSLYWVSSWLVSQSFNVILSVFKLMRSNIKLTFVMLSIVLTIS